MDRARVQRLFVSTAERGQQQRRRRRRRRRELRLGLRPLSLAGSGRSEIMPRITALALATIALRVSRAGIQGGLLG